MSMHTERFTGREALYAEYRERYDPEIVLPPLRDWCGLTSDWTIADIGAGTGMLSDVFLDNGNPVVAVEPNVCMRTTCSHLHAASPRLTLVDGTAEATGLQDASVDMVTVGRALHWFDLEPAMQEFRRILKPPGWLAIVAFSRAKEGREENEAFEEFLRPFTAEGKGTIHATYDVYRRLKDLFPAGELRHLEILGEMHLDWTTLRGLTFSLSHAPLPEASNFAAFDSGLADFFDHFQHDGKVTPRHGLLDQRGTPSPVCLKRP